MQAMSEDSEQSPQVSTGVPSIAATLSPGGSTENQQLLHTLSNGVERPLLTNGEASEETSTSKYLFYFIFKPLDSHYFSP